MSQSKGSKKPGVFSDIPAEDAKYMAQALTIAKQAGWHPRCDMCQKILEDFSMKEYQTRCKACKKVITVWDDAPSWAFLLNYNRDFIEGVRTATPYSIFPLFKDEKLHESILRLHDYGIMVVDAQPQYHEIGREVSGKWYEIKERAYLRCVIPTNTVGVPVEKVEAMLDMLLTAPNLEAIMFYEYIDYTVGKWLPHGDGYRCAGPIQTAREKESAKIPRSHYFRSSIGPSIVGKTVAKHRVADSKEGLVWTKWKRCKHNRLPVITERDLAPRSQGRRAFGRETKATMDARPVVFTVAVRNWNIDMPPLAYIVELACEEVGLEPIFEETSEPEKDKETQREVETPTKIEKLQTIFDRLAVK